MFTTYRFVNSTAIRFVAYDRNTTTLRVIFQNGSAYDYSDVPSATYVSLSLAPSVGSYYAAHVRNRFASERLSALESTRYMLDLTEAMHAQALLMSR